jgi:REP element-mobilizing transposase RayT
MTPRRRTVIGHHLILTGYGHWLPNDIRGSGSTEVRSDELRDLGGVHLGRKAVQPSREELRRFHAEAGDRLYHPVVWFDEAKRQAIADAFAQVIAQRHYTVWACAVLSNHAHLCIRRHRDDALTMWKVLASASCDSLQRMQGFPPNHPVWSSRPYKVFLYSPDDVRSRVRYIESNPIKERLPAQHFPFVLRYDGWPLKKV